MRVIGKIFLWLVIIVLILVVIAFLLPGQYKVERSITIGAKKSVIYQLTCNLKNWDLWTPWTKEVDSTVLFELSGNDCEPGTIWKWNGEILGNGELIVTEAVPGEAFGYELLFDKGKYVSKGAIVLKEVEDSVLVIWTDEGDLGFNPIARYMGLLMDSQMGKEFDKGLAKLKVIAEEREGWPAMKEAYMEKQTILVIRDSAGPETYGAVMGKGFSELMGFVKRNRLVPQGHPFAIYHTYDSVTMFSVFDMGIAVEYAVPGTGRIRVEDVPAQKVVIADYFGPYSQTARVYHAMDKYIQQSELTVTGSPWEIYVTDPMVEPDSMKWNTQILFPVQ